jgi:hypothetical protein
MKWLALFIFNIRAFSQNDPCFYFNQKSEAKWTEITKKIETFESPFYLSKKELLSIVSPEYISYSSSTNALEVIIVKSNLVINNNKLDLSFGPFQMKVSFILSTLRKAPYSIINDNILKKIKIKKNINENEIDYINKIETQWKILRIFEYNNKKNYKKHSLKGLYTIYNRGDINKIKSIFTKINCSKKTYEEWCFQFLNCMMK